MEHLPSLENAPSSKSSNKLEFHFLTLFPEICRPVLNSSVLGRAEKNSLVSFNLIQIRDFARDKNRTVDDRPYGGGEGMLLKADVLHAAWESVPRSPGQRSATVLLSPQGPLFDQKCARHLATTYSQLILVCGHYEGVDQRFIDRCVDLEISVGDYVLTGGELPALTIADAVTRLLPGVVGNPRSLSEESLENDLLKYPQYTRPPEFQGKTVPEVLLSGDHQAIRAWRDQQMNERTQTKRPDLWHKIKAPK